MTESFLPKFVPPWTLPDPHEGMRDEVNNYNWHVEMMEFTYDRRWLLTAATIAYLALVYFGPILMRDREPIKFKWMLFAWNIFLSVSSGIGFYHSIIYIVGNWPKHRDPVAMVCDTSCYITPLAWYMRMFVISKLLEWVDTVFLVLRKRPIIFLHWFHHVMTASYCWWGAMSTHQSDASGLYYSTLNLFVHFIMYGYYALSTLGIRPPFPWIITILQLSQMVVGVWISYTAMNCPRAWELNWHIAIASFAMYTIYVLLFAQFFLNRYVFSKKRPTKSVEGTKGDDKKRETKKEK
jgi:hypothetical protein